MEDRPVSAPWRTTLRGRARECALLDALIAAVRRGESRSLVLRGEAGIGKTALLEYLVDSASDLTVARIGGEESEMELEFASLHQLCAPMVDRRGTLPRPQRHALEVAFGMSGGAAPDRFLLALAVLGLLSEIAVERPLLCIVDDAQWLDEASAVTLAFVARRLAGEPVGIVFAARELGEKLRHIPVMHVPGLDSDDAQALLGSAVAVRLDARVRDRIVAETRGNPLGLLELPRGLTTTELAGGYGLLSGGGVPGRIDEGWRDRLEALPDHTRRLLVLAAADPTGDPLLLWRASELLGVDPAAAQRAQADGLLSVGEQVTFRHPLVRSAVYGRASVHERRTVHLALADATDRAIDPDRRAWHLAAAAAGRDDKVALELERSAGRAQARGGLAAAAAFLRRSVALTRGPSRRAKRALAAARASLPAGAFDSALGLLAAAEAGAVDDLQLAHVELLRGQIALASGPPGEAAAQLLAAAKRLEPLDADLARETYLDAWGAALFTGGPDGEVSLLEVSRAARAAPRAHSPHPSALLLDGLTALMTDGRAAAAPQLERAVEAFRGDDISVEKGLQWGVLASSASVELWDFESWDAVITRQMELARQAGALVPLSITLNGEGIVVAWSGDLAAGALVAAEADAVTEAAGTRIAPYGAMLLAALRGREAEASALIHAAVENATVGGEGLGVQYARWATAVLFNGLGRYDDALAAAELASDDVPDLFLAAWALPELIEAAVRSGRAQIAAERLDRLAASTEVSGTDWGLGIAARCRALLSEGDAADSLYREAIERLARTPLRPELARAHLLYGEWLRRENRRVDARAQLRAAHELFGSIGMEAFGERARGELLATGEKVRKRSAETRDELTAQEQQIARLAREGLTNPEIGARLYLSPRTVEWHLRKVFAKLGIHSRRELPGALPVFDPESVPV
jgi:DNA-binding CsgD family transcriptional regulator